MRELPLKIAVLMTCHNRVEKTLNCLLHFHKAIEQVAEHDFTIYLVDDGSTDDTGAAVRSRYPEIHVIEGDGNLFWNRGMHLAWKTAAATKDFDFYLWLNDDTNIFPDALVVAIDAALQQNKKAIIVGPTCSEKDQTLTYSGYDANENRIYPNGTLQKCRYFNGNFVLVPNLVFKTIGNLDPFFHHAIGDFDYGLRTGKAGFSSFVCGNFIGYCDKRDQLSKWARVETPFLKRVKYLYASSSNMQPFCFFNYELRHFGVSRAIKHFFSINLRICFPQLWKDRVQFFK